jgi:hexosaminidase
VVATEHAADLAGTAATLADDLATLIGHAVPVVTESRPAPGDLFLTIADGQGAETYRMSVGESVRIAGGDPAGVLYGTRTVLQLLHQASTIPAGTAIDWPSYPERGLMVDVGRKYFTVGWLRLHIREVSYLKLDYFHLHLSDDQGFRVESVNHPEVVSAEHYTKQDIRDLIAYGKQYHVMIVPELDMPGHMGAILAAHPDLQLMNNAGRIDLSNDGAYRLMSELMREHLPLFDAPYWHIGADEYLRDYARYPQLLAYAKVHYGAHAVAKDTYYGFINWANGIIRAAGKTTRMWNDGIGNSDGTISLATNIIVEYWFNQGRTPQQHVDRGHTVVNASWTPTYYVLRADRIIRNDVKYLYETWTPNRFGFIHLLTDPSRNLGAEIHVWCDHPPAQTEEQVADGIYEALRGLAQQTWGSPKPAPTYPAFQTLIAAVGRSPGYSQLLN